jgi:hypothetical protein
MSNKAQQSVNDRNNYSRGEHKRIRLISRLRKFISPNGFAEYYGEPKGRMLGDPDILVHPTPIKISAKNIAAAKVRQHTWKLAAAGVTGILLALLATLWKLTHAGTVQDCSLNTDSRLNQWLTHKSALC